MMNVILLENIKNVGKLGQVAKVAPGYARNFLIPQKKAMVANKANIDFFEKKKADLELKAQERLALAQQRADAFKGLELHLKEQATEEGKLFGAITLHEVLNAFEKKGQVLGKHEVRLPFAIREVGKFSIEVRLHSDIVVNVPLIVESTSTHS